MKLIGKERLPELREMFVKNRFAEESYFANSEIESWLESQKESTTPEVDERGKSPWSGYLHLLHKSGIKTRLCRRDGKDVTTRELLRSVGFRAEDVFADKTYSPVGWLRKGRSDIHLLVAKSISDEVYITNSILILYSRGGTPFNQVVLCPGLGCGGTYQTEGALSVQIADSLLLSWLYLPESDERKYRAREHLCETLSNIVTEVRAQTEEEFDGAVAVSEDGKKIITADTVIVWGGGRIKIISASSFHDRKIMREELVFRPAFSCEGDSVLAVMKAVEKAVALHDDSMACFCKHFGLTGGRTPVNQIYFPGDKKCFVILDERK